MPPAVNPPRAPSGLGGRSHSEFAVLVGRGPGRSAFSARAFAIGGVWGRLLCGCPVSVETYELLFPSLVF